MIYLNSASTTPLKKEVIEEINKVLCGNWGNPNDVFDFGKKSRDIINNSREIVASKINAKPEEIIFTCSGSAANALAMNGKKTISSNIEHSSITKNKNVDPILKCNEYGCINIGNVSNYDLSKYDMVSVMASNNEIGTINNIKNISEYVHKKGLLMHSDCTQYFPYNKIDVKDINADYITISGHKLGVPSGVGALYIKEDTKTEPLIPGSQENELFGGTENVAYIAAFAKAVDLLDYSDSIYIETIRDYFERKIKEEILNCYINCVKSERTCHISNVCFPSVDSITLQTLLGMEEIYVSSKSACSEYELKPSRILSAIGMTEPDIHCCLRFSFSKENTVQEIDYVVQKIKESIEMLKLVGMQK